VLTEGSKYINHQADNEPREAQASDVPAGCSGRQTPSLEEGPFYKTGSPERTSIAERGTVGSKLVVEGYVFDRNCQPIAKAWLDFWQADGSGAYDNAGYNLRGHQYTDENGHYHLETVRPVEYGPRTAHIHAEVRANDDSPVLTVQLFLPGEKRNQTDPIFDGSLIMNIVDAGGGEKATFNFVLN
jgi:protocatechuate 3,4-dioxygenase beta subunit